MEYGIAKTPHNAAFLNHLMSCGFCYPRSNKYCDNGKRFYIEQHRESKGYLMKPFNNDSISK